ncbi:MAG TPA: DUF4190 domain-containing protein [Verrucomicrobiae bacterium]|jgi:type II secretory pathway pseudopilin PulG|nr:DUF4190 domain-containing protein [Verrucomicrobiae bacterium]
MFCSKCGAHIDDQAKVCPQCGSTSPVMPQPALPPADRVPQMTPVFSPVPMASVPQTDPKAIWSMVLGFVCLFCGIFAAIPAVILGHMARSSIRKSGGRLKGDGMAITGLVIGYIYVALAPLIIAAIAIPNLLKARSAANESAAAATVRTINTSQATYSTMYPAAGYAPNLETLGPGPTANCTDSGTAAHACLIDRSLACSSSVWCLKGSFKYSVVGVGSPTPSDYVITATPVDSRRAERSYCSTAEGIVRYKRGVVLAPITLEECQSWEAL